MSFVKIKIKSFENKRIYIFGGSSGIGLATAKKLSQAGAHIIIFARGVEKLEKAVDIIQQNRLESSRQSGFFSVDVSDPRQVNEVMEKAAAQYGPPDILLNCAGRACPRRFEDVSVEQFHETMAINTNGIWYATQAAFPYMKERGGYIVNVSSIAGFLGIYGYTDYAASKFAIMGLSEALRNEFKPLNIGVSVLCPPDTDTPGFEAEERTKPEETKAISANAKLMEPDEVADALIKGMKKGKAVIIPGMDGKLIYMAKRLFPRIVEFVMDNTVKKTQHKMNR